MSDTTPIARRQQLLNLSSLGSPDTITSATPIPITPHTININTTRRSGSLRSPPSRELLHPDVEALADNPIDDELRTILMREYNIDHNLSNSGGSSTPRRQGRGDIHPTRNDIKFSENDEDDNMTSTNNIPTTIDVRETIWGTNIKLERVKITFKRFLREFRRQFRQEKEGIDLISTDADPFYVQYMHKIEETKIYVLNLDTKNLLAYEPSEKLYHQLIRYPQDLIPIMDEVVTETYNELCSEQTMMPIKVRAFNLEKSINMRDLNPSGLIIRTSPILPIMSTAYFRCSICDKSEEVTVIRGKIDEPSKCPRLQCNSVGTMNLIHNRSYYKDKQICRLQETPDCIPDGQTPHTITICLYDDLVDVIRPGDKVVITGIYRSFPIRLNPNKRTIKSLFKTFVDAIHISKTDKSRLSSDSVLLNENEYAPNYDETDNISCKRPDTTNQVNPFDLKEVGTKKDDEQRTKPKFTDVEINDFERLSKQRFAYETLANSLAPSIFGLDDVKKGILLQLFGGVHKKFEKSGSPRFRGDINILLVGDPGTGKSQLLQYVHKMSPRGVYTSGKGSSAVGLTAYVTRDPDSKQMVLESGALVLSDGGICCIDEFDKMSEGTRAVLHEVMEQQTLSVAKAGIITSLNARASILASANPVNSKYDPKLSIVQNIKLPPTLMSRFATLHIFFLLYDVSDTQLAKHLISLYTTNNDNAARPGIVPFETLSKYISYAKTHFDPKIEDDATQTELAKIYVELRKLGQDSLSSEKIVTATPRQLESMIRLAEAHARMRLSKNVNIHDVREAERLLREAMKTAAWDPETGRIDMDLITTGHNINDRERGADKLLKEDEENGENE
ncbi:10552_t:CDS:10 [Entrophospora sp. SA101]|nr:10552_t:CDS:10 [Entrophospora sp. SA101]